MSYRYEPRCEKCKGHLMTSEEIDFGICDDCCDAMYHREQKRREWNEYHPGEPCPEIEMK